ncbi:MAG: SAM-dependent chlorinase/fluorinase [Kofleriaceae bacterium]|nr:SAM-dependent chlorinase/fluorinase [Kofleriaceae bacterium]
MPIITLTTDFGTRDGYVGAMKGVIARLAPDARIFDIAHDVPRGDIAHAAWVVSTSAWEFPQGSIHVVVVDPGVGGTRREVIVRASGQWFVGPDNGVFAHVTDAHSEARSIDASWFRAKRVSRTFHGRDVFATAAAALARGDDVTKAGDVVKLVGVLPWGQRQRGEGRIVHIDHYGNLISDLPPSEAKLGVTIAGHTLAIAGTYEDVPSGQLLAYIGSARTIEVAVRDGRADTRLGVERGAAIIPASIGPYR